MSAAPEEQVSPADEFLICESMATPDVFASVFERHFDWVRSYAARRVGLPVADEIAGEAVSVKKLLRTAIRRGLRTP